MGKAKNVDEDHTAHLVQSELDLHCPKKLLVLSSIRKRVNFFIFLNKRCPSYCLAVLTLYHSIPAFNNPTKKTLENIVGKGENAGNQHFLLIPQCFLPTRKQILFSQLHLFCRLQLLSI